VADRAGAALALPGALEAPSAGEAAAEVSAAGTVEDFFVLVGVGGSADSSAWAGALPPSPGLQGRAPPEGTAPNRPATITATNPTQTTPTRVATYRMRRPLRPDVSTNTAWSR
jgi:hypothetical protein